MRTAILVSAFLAAACGSAAVGPTARQPVESPVTSQSDAGPAAPSKSAGPWWEGLDKDPLPEELAAAVEDWLKEKHGAAVTLEASGPAELESTYFVAYSFDTYEACVAEDGEQECEFMLVDDPEQVRGYEMMEYSHYQCLDEVLAYEIEDPDYCGELEPAPDYDQVPPERYALWIGVAQIRKTGSDVSVDVDTIELLLPGSEGTFENIDFEVDDFDGDGKREVWVDSKGSYYDYDGRWWHLQLIVVYNHKLEEQLQQLDNVWWNNRDYDPPPPDKRIVTCYRVELEDADDDGHPDARIESFEFEPFEFEELDGCWPEERIGEQELKPELEIRLYKPMIDYWLEE